MTIQADAFAVLLPAIPDLKLTEPLARFLNEGGRALLIGESREEYVARQMTDRRRADERADDIAALAATVRRRAGTALIALDQEPAGIGRLHDLVPQFPDRPAMHRMPSADIEAIAFEQGELARQMGVNMFLSPVLDVVTGRNSWLEGRHLGADAAEVARIGAAFIRGVEAAGIVAVAKHFPGHHDIDGDPALEIATVSGGHAELAAGLLPFHEAIAAGARAIMTGPALVPGMDPVMPTSLSAVTIATLRNDFGFAGLVVSDDLDAIATLRGQRDVPTAVIEALRAGSDLLLLSAENDLGAIRARIVAAVTDGTLPSDRLAEAAARVRDLAD